MFMGAEVGPAVLKRGAVDSLAMLARGVAPESEVDEPLWSRSAGGVVRSGRFIAGGVEEVGSRAGD